MEPSAGNFATNDFSRLLSEARGGSTEAIGKLLKRCENNLASHADVSPRYQTKFDASDLVQETFLKAFRHFADFVGNTFLEWQAWLRATLNRVLITALRHYRRARRNIDNELSVDQAPFALKQFLTAKQPLHPLVAAEDEALLWHVCNSQPGQYRDIIRLRMEEGLGFAAIGSRLGCSAEAARKRWSRVGKMIYREFTASDPPDLPMKVRAVTLPAGSRALACVLAFSVRPDKGGGKYLFCCRADPFQFRTGIDNSTIEPRFRVVAVLFAVVYQFESRPLSWSLSWFPGLDFHRYIFPGLSIQQFRQVVDNDFTTLSHSFRGTQLIVTDSEEFFVGRESNRPQTNAVFWPRPSRQLLVLGQVP